MKFTPRDLITIGIFGALIIVAEFSVGMLGIISPPAMFVSIPLTTVVACILFAVFCARVHQAGMAFLLIMVISLVMAAAGEGLWVVSSGLVAGLLAELALRGGHYRSATGTVLASGGFGMMMFGAILPVLWNAEAYFAKMAAYPADYVNGMRSLFTTPMVLLLMALMVASALTGGFLGVRLTAKHFRPAGVVA